MKLILVLAITSFVQAILLTVTNNEELARIPVYYMLLGNCQILSVLVIMKTIPKATIAKLRRLYVVYSTALATRVKLLANKLF